MKTDFDESIGNINVISQDIGRVVLNLINNAFYAVDEKKKQSSDGYEPTVSVGTKKINGKVEIKVTDNGNGIPQKVIENISTILYHKANKAGNGFRFIFKL
jgi:signal transduction histidine kinase